jgi:hypothetical protein
MGVLSQLAPPLRDLATDEQTTPASASPARDPSAELAERVGNGTMADRLPAVDESAPRDEATGVLDAAAEALGDTPGAVVVEAEPTPASEAPGAAEAAPAATPAEPARAPEPTAPAETKFTSAAQKVVYDELRGRAYAVAWMSALQGHVGVPVTGVASLELANEALTAHPLELPKKKGSAERAAVRSLDAALRDWRAQFPDLATIPDKGEPVGELSKSGGSRGAGAEAPEDEALRDSKYHTTYAQYVSSVLKTGSFLGFSVVAHPEFHARLGNATTYLQSKFPGRSPPDIAKELGIYAVSHFRPSSATSNQMYHGLGFAIDLNKPTNDWHLGKNDDSWDLGPIMGRVSELFGTPEVRSAKGLAKNSRENSTEGAWALLEKSNQDLVRYREFADDPAAFEAFYQSEACPPSARRRSLAEWKKALAKDQATLRKDMKNEEGRSDKVNRGLMDLKLETVQAMRDAAGLRWGGTDLGGDSGDLMHFDGGSMDTASTLRDLAATARKRQKAAKAEAAKTTTE